MEAVAKELCIRQFDEPRWPLFLAEAIRHTRSMQESLEVLVQAGMRFPGKARIFYRNCADCNLLKFLWRNTG